MDAHTTTAPRSASGAAARQILITAGPTHEPIDAVRFIGNRSSGRVGIAVADEASRRGWGVTLLLGPTHRIPYDSRIRVVRFRTAAELEGLLRAEAGGCDVLVMAAAVADFRPKANPGMWGGKFRRTEGPLTLELESTPDLLAAVAASRKPGQLLIGFALEPRAEMVESAKRKLARKDVDLVVANPLETMDAEEIEAVVVGKDGGERRTAGVISKEAFAPWLLDVIELELAGHGRAQSGTPVAPGKGMA